MAMLRRSAAALGGILLRSGGAQAAARSSHAFLSSSSAATSSPMTSRILQHYSQVSVSVPSRSIYNQSRAHLQGGRKGIKFRLRRAVMKIRNLSEEAVFRYWTPLNLREKFGAMYVLALAILLFDSAYDLHCTKRKLQAVFEQAEERRARRRTAECASAETDVSQV